MAISWLSLARQEEATDNPPVSCHAAEPVKQAGALERARAIAPIPSELAGMSARAVAAELNARQVETPSGAPWSAKTVIRARERLAV
jgi:hypothetical protein